MKKFEENPEANEIVSFPLVKEQMTLEDVLLFLRHQKEQPPMGIVLYLDPDENVGWIPFGEQKNKDTLWLLEMSKNKILNSSPEEE